MPFSDNQGKDVIREWLRTDRRVAVLDIGPGSGTYGKMVREVQPNNWQLIAIEAWEPYVEEFNLDSIYDEVRISDVRDAPASWVEAFDYVIVGDVIEHMPRADAEKLLLRLTSPGWATNYKVIVSFPVLHLDQGPYAGNHYEVHVDHWTIGDMDVFCAKNGIQVLDKGHGDVLAWYMLEGRKR